MVSSTPPLRSMARTASSSASDRPIRNAPPGTSRNTTPDGMCRHAGRPATISSVHMAANASSQAVRKSPDAPQLAHRPTAVDA